MNIKRTPFSGDVYIFNIPAELSNFFIKFDLLDYLNRKDTHEEYSTFLNVLEDIINECIRIQLNPDLEQDILDNTYETITEYISSELVMLEYIQPEHMTYFFQLILELVEFIINKLVEKDLINKQFALADITPTYVVFKFVNKGIIINE